MRLNNKGWGLSTFIMFLCIFFIALIVLVIVANIIAGRDDRGPMELIESASN